LSIAKLKICSHCKGKGIGSNMIKVEKVMSDKITLHSYFHHHCIQAKKNGIRKFDICRKLTGNTESKSHKVVKNDILKGLLGNVITLVDHFGNNYNPKGDYMACEMTMLENVSISYLEDNTCKLCFDRYKLSEYENGEWINKDELMQSVQINKVAHRMNKDKDIICLKSHPCTICKFNTYYFKFIFDIGIINKGKLDTVIEVYNTSEVKKEKLQYCIENNIQLFEVNVKDVKKINMYKETEIRCNKLWWIENGEIVISDKYK